MSKKNSKEEELKKEAIKAFEEACRSLLWGKEKAEQNLINAIDRVRHDSIKRKEANEEFNETIEKLDKNYMNSLYTAKKAGLSSRDINEIKERIADEVDNEILRTKLEVEK